MKNQKNLFFIIAIILLIIFFILLIVFIINNIKIHKHNKGITTPTIIPSTPTITPSTPTITPSIPTITPSIPIITPSTVPDVKLEIIRKQVPINENGFIGCHDSINRNNCKSNFCGYYEKSDPVRDKRCNTHDLKDCDNDKVCKIENNLCVGYKADFGICSECKNDLDCGYDSEDYCDKGICKNKKKFPGCINLPLYNINNKTQNDDIIRKCDSLYDKINFFSNCENKDNLNWNICNNVSYDVNCKDSNTNEIYSILNFGCQYKNNF